MNSKERIKRMIAGEKVDYLPSQVDFADKTRKESVKQAIGISLSEDLDKYLGNSVWFLYQKQDIPWLLRNDLELQREMEKEGYCKIDLENNVIYDEWGMGFKIGEDGLCMCFHPLENQITDKDFLNKWIPERLHESCMAEEFEDRVRLWTAPNPHKEGIMDYAAKTKLDQGDEYFYLACGYIGVHERCYGLMSFGLLMENMLLEPELIGELMDKVTDYKIEIAKNFIELGVDCGHMGDDLGTQTGQIFGPAQFKELVLPRYKRLWKTYKDAGLPMAMHSCGDITPYIPYLIDIGLDVLHPVQPCMDQEFLVQEYGDKLVFFGGIDTQDLLPNGTVEEVKKGTLEVMKNLGKKGKCIIGPSQEVMKDVPMENILAMLDVIRDNRQNVCECL